MAVLEQIPEVRYVANGATTAFSFEFYVPTIDDLVVQIDGVRQPGGFSVTGLGQAFGQIAFSVAPANGATVAIQRETALERLTDYQQQGDFRAKTVNIDFDRPILALQENAARARRSILTAVGETGFELPPAGLNPNRVFGTDGAGNFGLQFPGSGTQLAMDLLDPAPGKNASLIRYYLRDLFERLQDSRSVADFGAIGDGVADDTAAWNAAIAYGIASTKMIKAVGKTGKVFKITASLEINGGPVTISGDGRYSSMFRASGNFTALFAFGGAAAGCRLEHLGLDQAGTMTQLLFGVLGSQVVEVHDCNLSGDVANKPLVYSASAGFFCFEGCSFYTGSSTTGAIQYDSAPQNCHVARCVFGGPGNGISVTSTLGIIIGGTGPQGLRIENNVFINAGYTIALLGQAYQTVIMGNVLDGGGVLLGDGAALTQIVGNWIGGNAGASLLLQSSTGPSTTIKGNNINGTTSCIQIGASATQRVRGVIIDGNTFTGAAVVNALMLDSVFGCSLSNNIDLSASSGGSIAFLKSFVASGGVYSFGGGNQWASQALSSVNLAQSSFRALPDIGITFANRGVATSTVGSGTLVVNHGCALTPNNIQLTPLGNAGAYYVSNVTATSFTINFATTGSVITWSWSAEFVA